MIKKDKIRVIESSDKEEVERIKAAIRQNDGFCPCKLEKTEDTKCPCKDFRKAIENKQEGKCHCGLYQIIREVTT